MSTPNLHTVLEGLEALTMLERFGTVSEAATRLRLTQSAVSKRLQALQRALGMPLLAPKGRRVELTLEAVRLLERSRAPIAELRALTVPQGGAAAHTYSLALADSIAASWGPKVVAKALAAVPAVAVELHAHRSVLVIESVRLGRYQLGLSTSASTPADLVRFELVREPMVVVASGFATANVAAAGPTAVSPLITIEAGSETWRTIEPQLRAHQRRLVQSPLLPVESFSAALQMAKAGFGNALVPLGLARERAVPPSACRVLKGVERPVALLARKTVLQLPSFEGLRAALVRAAASAF